MQRTFCNSSHFCPQASTSATPHKPPALVPPPPPTFTTNRPPFLRSSAVAVPPHDRHLREILSQARRSFRSPLSAHICPRGAHTTCSQAQHLQASLARGYSRRRSIHDSQRSPAAATAARAGRRRAATASHVSNGRRHGRTRTALTRRQCRYPHARGRSFHSARQADQSKSDRSLLILNKMNPTVANHAPAATQPTKEEKKHHVPQASALYLFGSPDRIHRSSKQIASAFSRLLRLYPAAAPPACARCRLPPNLNPALGTSKCRHCGVSISPPCGGHLLPPLLH